MVCSFLSPAPSATTCNGYGVAGSTGADSGTHLGPDSECGSGGRPKDQAITHAVQILSIAGALSDGHSARIGFDFTRATGIDSGCCPVSAVSPAPVRHQIQDHRWVIYAPAPVTTTALASATELLGASSHDGDSIGHGSGTGIGAE